MSKMTKLALWYSQEQKGDTLGIRFGDKEIKAVFMHGDSMMEVADKLEELVIAIRKYETELTNKKE